nr:hypothetical protein CFP56_31529 [Quercus suber]
MDVSHSRRPHSMPHHAISALDIRSTMATDHEWALVDQLGSSIDFDTSPLVNEPVNSTSNRPSPHETLAAQVQGDGDQWEESPPRKQSLTAPPDLRRAMELFAQDYARLKDVRQESLLLRSRSHHEHETYRHSRQFVQKSQNAFMKELTKVIEHIPAAPRFHELRNLYQQLEKDQASSETEAARVKAIELELSAIDYSMARLEKSLGKSARRVLKPAEGIKWPVATGSLEPDPGMPHPTEEKSPTLSIDPMLLDFFDKVGKVSIMQDRVYQLEEEHQDDRIERELELDRGQVPEISEEEFMLAFETDYLEATNDLLLAKDARNKAQALCEKHDIDVEAHLNKDANRLDAYAATESLRMSDSCSSLSMGLAMESPATLRFLSPRLIAPDGERTLFDMRAQSAKDKHHNRILDWIPTMEHGLDILRPKPPGHSAKQPPSTASSSAILENKDLEAHNLDVINGVDPNGAQQHAEIIRPHSFPRHRHSRTTLNSLTLNRRRSSHSL